MSKTTALTIVPVSVTPVTVPGPDANPCMVAVGKLITPELKANVVDHVTQGRQVVYELICALRELKPRYKTTKIWQKTLLECGIKPATWRQWEFRELNQVTTGKRTGDRKPKVNVVTIAKAETASGRVMPRPPAVMPRSFNTATICRSDVAPSSLMDSITGMRSIARFSALAFRRAGALSHVHPEPFATGVGRHRAGVVDADVAFELCHSSPIPI